MSLTSILSIATALPPHSVSQIEAKSAAKAMFNGRDALFDRLAGVFDNALIDRRQTVAPIDWYREPHGWAERTDLYVAATEALFEQSAKTAITRAGLAPADIDRFCCHPGGAKVIEAIETALALGPGTLDLERDTLRDHGNMSAPTVLFVLDALIKRGLPDRVMMTAFGPGFTCAGLVLEQ